MHSEFASDQVQALIAHASIFSLNGARHIHKPGTVFTHMTAGLFDELLLLLIHSVSPL
jgi:hypothetical protein